jgi:hypothetical protein
LILSIALPESVTHLSYPCCVGKLRPSPIPVGKNHWMLDFHLLLVYKLCF